MEEAKEYEAWCKDKKYKLCDPRALVQFYEEKRIRLFKSKMALFGDTLNSLSDYLGIKRQTLSRKIRDGSFNQGELSLIKKRYNLSDAEFSEIVTKEIAENESQRSGC